MLTNDDGTVYDGDFKEGKMDGRGTKIYANGDQFDGKFKENVQHGQGQFFKSKTGEKVKVEFRDGKKWTWSKNNVKSKNNPKNPLNALLQIKDGNQIRREGWAK